MKRAVNRATTSSRPRTRGATDHMNAPNLFEYPPEVADVGAYITGFEVHAVDGVIGIVAAANYDHGQSWLVVDTDFWIFGERRLFPAGTVRGVSREARKLFVGMTKDEIRDAPEYDEEQHRTDERAYLGGVGSYYEPWAPLRAPLEFHRDSSKKPGATRNRTTSY